jgi:4-hydroxy-2-oxoheptanedioate aldolase
VADVNRTRARLADGQAVFGCLLRHPDAGIAELLALQGFDFVVFDGEHGTLTPQACEHLVRAVELHGVTPLVRVDENRAAPILRYLDAGALGCHIPGVDSPEDALRAVRAVKFRPDGDRGLAGSRASGFGPAGGYPAYIARANGETQVVVHVESAAGVDAADEIAAVDGVDVLLVGTLDLSHDLGRPGDLEHPDVIACAERVAAAAAASGKVLGAVVTDVPTAHMWLARGARYLVTTLDSLVVSSVRRYLSNARVPLAGAANDDVLRR